MTVQELIVRLQALPPTHTVVMPAERGGNFWIVEQAFIDTVQFQDGEAMLADERDESWVEVVRLFGPEPEQHPG